MKTSFRNIALVSTLLFVPLKSTTTVQPAKHAVKKATSECTYLLDLVKQRNEMTYDFISAPLAEFKAKEARKALNIIKMPKPTKDLDVSKTKFVGHPEFLNMFLSGVLKGKGEKFIEAQEKHGINATFLVGIANLESGNGLSDFARNRNNIAGMRTAKGYMHFDSVDECIDKMAENLKRNYVEDGLTTISKIHKRYAEDPKWADVVVERMSPIYDASKCMIYDFENNIRYKK